jgi:hypothetical protein
MLLAMLLSLVFIAEVMFLPFRILVLQGLPLFLVIVAATYIGLQILEQVEFEVYGND